MTLLLLFLSACFPVPTVEEETPEIWGVIAYGSEASKGIDVTITGAGSVGEMFQVYRATEELWALRIPFESVGRTQTDSSGVFRLRPAKVIDTLKGIPGEIDPMKFPSLKLTNITPILSDTQALDSMTNSENVFEYKGEVVVFCDLLDARKWQNEVNVTLGSWHNEEEVASSTRLLRTGAVMDLSAKWVACYSWGGPTYLTSPISGFLRLASSSPHNALWSLGKSVDVGMRGILAIARNKRAPEKVYELAMAALASSHPAARGHLIKALRDIGCKIEEPETRIRASAAAYLAKDECVAKDFAVEHPTSRGNPLWDTPLYSDDCDEFRRTHFEELYSELKALECLKFSGEAVSEGHD